MVFMTSILKGFASRSNKAKKGFIDSLVVTVRGGTGGSGLPKYGGMGGQGGAVICVGSPVESLRHIALKYPHKFFGAKHGENSAKKKIVGEPGEDCIINVPVGISILDEDGRKLGEINELDEKCIVARGGPGGGPPNNFIGYEGQNRKVTLDLRLIADVGLIGFPNAGKSTFLKAISKANPKIANYPFTTLKPNIGIMEFRDKRQISVADLPGLIEGAHINIGLGHKFLKHVERTKVLLFLADLTGFALSHEYPLRSCLETVVLLNKELEMYNADLLNKPAILALNKVDLLKSQSEFDEIAESIANVKKNADSIDEAVRPKTFIQFEHIVGISAMNNGTDVEDLKWKIRNIMDVYADSGILPEDVAQEMERSTMEHGPRIT